MLSVVGQHSSRKLVSIYLPPEMHRWLKVKAAEEGTTISALLEAAAQRSMSEPGVALRIEPHKKETE